MTSKQVKGWAILDEVGGILLMTVAPSRIDAIRMRIRMNGAEIRGYVPEHEVEEFWRANKGKVEDVVPVNVSVALN